MKSTMTLLHVAFTLSIYFYIVVNGQSECRWDAYYPGGSSSLDLSCAVGKELKTTDSRGHDYVFTICSNGLSCSGQNVMAQQTYQGANCYSLGSWDQSIQPTFSLANGGMFTFEFANGDDGCGGLRTWVPTFRCDDAEFEIDQVTEVDCQYSVEIHTKYACSGNRECSIQPSGLADSLDGLSGGWIFIIIFVSAIFAYCMIGYFVMAFTVNKQGGLKDFSNNIPQKTFWIVCPKLVIAGCGVSKEFVVNEINKRRGGGNDDTLLEEL